MLGRQNNGCNAAECILVAEVETDRLLVEVEADKWAVLDKEPESQTVQSDLYTIK